MRSLHKRGLATVAWGTALSCIVGFAYTQIPAKQPSGNAECVSNMKQMGLAIQMYMQDYDACLPPLSDSNRFRTVLFPYTKRKEIFNCPVSKLPFTINAKIVPGGTPKPFTIALAQVGTPAKTVIIYDPKPHSDKSYGVGYLDGHVKREAKLPPLGMR